jgi:hypothetical protein
MPRQMILAAAFIASLAACSSPARPDAAPTQGTAAPVSATGSADEAPALVMDTPTVCAAVDGIYTGLGPSAQAQVAQGVAAEKRGDTATVKQTLDALHPVFTSTAAAFADTADKVTDPALKTALNSLADAATTASRYTTFAEFPSMAGLTSQGEAVIKQKCAAAGYTLKNVA